MITSCPIAPKMKFLDLALNVSILPILHEEDEDEEDDEAENAVDDDDKDEHDDILDLTLGLVDGDWVKLVLI